MFMYFAHELEALGMNEPGSALTHGIAAVLAPVILILLIIKAAFVGSAWHIVGVIIFGLTLMFTYSMSFSYHLVPKRYIRAKSIMQRLDHGSIYFLIAGTYTPICLTVLRGPLGWSLFGVVWALCITGSVLKFSGVHMPNWLTPIVYIALGWIAAIAIMPLYYALSIHGIYWLVGGGLAYTVAVIFFALEDYIPRTKWWGMHEIFHLFIMLGTLMHIVLIWKYIL